MDRKEVVRIAVSGLAAGVLLLVLAVPFALADGGFEHFGFLAVALYQATWCFVEGWIVQRYRPLSAIREARCHFGPLPFVTALASILIVAVVVWDTCRFGPTVPAMVLIGYFVGGVGVLMRQSAIMELGTFFRDSIDLDAGHEFVSTGIYAICRHPAEIGFGLAMAGLLFISGSLLAMILFAALLVPLILVRMRLENLLLRERFGGQI